MTHTEMSIFLVRSAGAFVRRISSTSLPQSSTDAPPPCLFQGVSSTPILYWIFFPGASPPDPFILHCNIMLTAVLIAPVRKRLFYRKNLGLKEIVFFVHKIPVCILLSPFVALYCGLRKHLIPSRYDNNHINDYHLCMGVYVLS